MNNTYRKFFKVLRAWWVTLMLLAFIPMANAQTITGISVDTPNGYPESTVVVTLNVTGFTGHATYNYYVVYDYSNYDKLLQFTHNQTTNIVKTLDGSGDGTIAITATVPKELYTYSQENITVLAVSANGNLVYQLTPYVPPGSTYPVGPVINVGSESFANYNNTPRVFDTSVELESAFFGFDASTNFSFTLRRLNPEPAIKSEIRVQYKKGAAGTWTNIRTLSLNNAGGGGLFQTFSSADTDWPAGIVGNDISVKITQIDGEGLSSGIDTWAVENLTFNNVLSEPSGPNPYTLVFGHFYVKDLVGGNPFNEDFEILAPGFSIASITPPAAGYYPGEVATYNILSGANVSFPDATIFEVYLTQDFGGGPVQEILLGTFPLTGGTGLPAATTNRDFTFITPFMPGTNWYLNVRADLRDYTVHDAIGPFTIEGVNLTATLNYTKTPAAQQFELDGLPYLFPGSTVHVDYNLGALQTINTTTYNVNVVLEYHNGDEWVELKSQAFSMTPASQTINAALPSTITAANVPLRLRLANGTKKDLATAYISRWVDDFFSGNFEWLPYEVNANGLSAPAGSTFGFQLFAVNNTAQGLVVEYKDDNQPLWTSLGTINSLATDNKYVSNYATTTNNYSIVPTGQLTVENPKFRIRWADGGPLGLNKGILRGYRYQEPQVINVVSNGQSVRVLYPHLTMSPNIVDLYEFADDEASVSITVDYSKWKIPAAAQVAVILIEDGNNPMVDPYLYLGSKAAGATDGEDFQTFSIAYSKIEEVFGELPQLPDPAMEFDVWMFLTDKDAADPIMFKTEEKVVGWKDGYDEQPMMITEAIDLTGLNTPLFLSYDWIVTTAPSPMNDLTRPVLEYTKDEGVTWTKIDQHDFNTMLPIQTAWISNQTRFRWTQTIELGEWDVQNVKILSGVDNLVTYEYGMTGIPQEIELALAAEDVPPVVDPCEDFNLASLSAYKFTPSETTVNVGEDVEFDWTFLGAAKSKTIVDQELTANGQYLLGVNEMEFTLDFSTDKKVTQFVMTFPTGVTPSAATVINVDGNTLTPTISTTARTVTYASAAGVVSSGPVDFNVTFAVAGTVSDTISVAFTITDVDGTKNGVCKIAPALAFPEGTEFYFYIPDPNVVKDDKALTGVSLDVTSPAVFTPGFSHTLHFNLNADSPDWEYVEYIRITFPAGVTINSAPTIAGDYGSTFNPYISGQVIEFYDGAFDPFSTGITVYPFTVNITVHPSYEGSMVMNWFVEGDGWGAAPHSVSGTTTLNNSEFPSILINKDGLPITMDMDKFFFNIPDNVPTAAYDIYVKVVREYEEEAKGFCLTPSTLVYEDLFVVNNQTPEVYQIELTEVNFQDPDEDYYWGKDVEVKFETFGPWQDFEDLYYEVVLTQYVYEPLGELLNENFEGTVLPAGWNIYNIDGAGSTWNLSTNYNHTAAGTRSIRHNYSTAGMQNGWLVTPALNVPADGSFYLNFWSYNAFSTWYYKNSVLISTGSPNPASGDFVEIWSPGAVSGAWVETTLSLAAYSGQTIYVAFRYEGNDAHDWYLDDVLVASSDIVKRSLGYHYLGEVAHVDGQYQYSEIFALPTFEELEDTDFDLDIEGTTFEVEVYAFQGEEGDVLIFGELLENINEFYLLRGTEDETTPLTFDVPNVLRYAITNKLSLAGYEGQEVYLQFTYSAQGISAPNYLTLPVLQVTMDNGLSYIDIEVPGSAFEEQARLDAQALNKVYRYKIPVEYMTNNTRFRWYQEVPDGVWSIGNITVTKLTNEVPIEGYYINDPAYTITITEEVIPEFCDQFDPASFAGYIWNVEGEDEVSGFDLPVYANEDFDYNFTFDNATGLDEFPAETEFMFYINKFASTFNKSEASGKSNTMLKISKSDELPSTGFESTSTPNIAFGSKEDEDVEAQWIHWDDGIGVGSVGLTSAGEWYSFARFFPEDIELFEDFALSRIAVAVRHLPSYAHIVIWQGPDVANLVEVYRQPFAPVADSWNEILLNEPYEFNREEELWIGIMWGDPGAGVFPAYRDAATDANGKGNLIVMGGSLYYLTDFGITGDWNIQGYVEPALVTINKDGLPITLGEASYIGFVPDYIPTGIYEVLAQASLPEDVDGNSCNFGFRIIKDDLLIINNNSNPDDVIYLTLDGLYAPEEEEEEDKDALTEFLVGEKFDAMYSTYGPWPTGVNFAAVYGETILGQGQETGEGVLLEDLVMPYIPFEDATQPFHIYAFMDEELILGDVEIEFDIDDMVLYGYNDDFDRFDQEGNRWAATQVLNLTDLDENNTKIWFDYESINVTPSAATLPVFEVSVNGGTSFTTLLVLDENKQYSASVGNYLGETTVFRWRQPANFGLENDMWTLENIWISSGDANYVFRSNGIDVTQIVPEIDVDYYFEIPLDEDDLVPAIYAGNSFDFIFDVVDDGNAYPEGTVFTIELHFGGDIVYDHVTGEEVVLYQGTEVGELTATAPIVMRETYQVFVKAEYDGYLYDEAYIGVINIFNPVIRTSIVGNDVPYAGGKANFKGTLESNLNLTLNNTYWYNLILADGGDEWLLAAQQGGTATFNNVDLKPVYFSGPQTFRIRASIGGPLGEVGEIIPARNANEWLTDFGTAAFAEGDRVTKKYVGEDLDIDFSDFEFMSFDIKFTEDIETLTENQHLILEYSIDGGMTYTAIHTYPDERFTDEAYFNGDWFEERNLPIPADAQDPSAILRFRIQELKGTVDVVDIELIAKWDIQYAPYYALNSIINIAKQRVEITGFDAVSYVACDNVDVEIFYNIRGSFGDDVEYFLYANGTDTEFMPMLGTEGSGSFIFNVDESFDALQFRIDAEDATFDDDWGTIYVDGDESDLIAIEIVPEIIDAAGDPLISAMNDYSCDVAERFLLVNFPQDYFVYQVRNALTHEPLSEEVLFDPELDMLVDGVLPISIGVVDSRIIVEVVVTAQSKDGSLVCETMVLNEQVVFDVRNLAIQYLWDNNNIGGVWMNVPEDAGDMIICYGSNDFYLRIWDYSMDNGNGGVVNADIKWYRDVEMIAPVGATGMINTFPLSGGYYAVITSEFCDVWTSQAVSVVVEDAPVKPIIEFIGSQELCEGEHATLQIAADYEFYRWYRNGWLIEGSNTNWIDIYQSGYYEVEVSNYPFDPFVPVCTQFSDGLSVDLNIHYKPYIPSFYVVDNTLCEPMPAQIVLSTWDENVWYQAYILETGEPTGAAKLGYQGNLVLETDVLDHEVFLGVMAWRMGVETCDPVYSTQVYEVAVYNLTIEVSGNVLIASLAPYDNRVSSYQWYKNNVAIQNNGTGRTLTIYDEASYSVKVRTTDGCMLTATLAKADEDTTPDVVPSSMTASLYPNPVQDNLTLKLDGNYLGNIQVRIINLAGVVIYDLNAEKAAVEFEQVISVDNLTQGVYIIQITGGEYSEVKRFIKK